MSFILNWDNLDQEALNSYARELLTTALNSGTSLILSSAISIKDLQFGSTPPSFELLEIGDLDSDKFRGIFKIDYSGDFSLVLSTMVQANPLNLYNSPSFVSPGFALADASLDIPLDLSLSSIRLSGIGIIVFSSTKGLTLVFRNDPLTNITVSSTFDTVHVLATFLQNQIESQIRDLFRETLPTLIHQLSRKYLKLDGINLGVGINTGVKNDNSGNGVKSGNSGDIRTNEDSQDSRDSLVINESLAKNGVSDSVVGDQDFNSESEKFCNSHSRRSSNTNSGSSASNLSKSDKSKFGHVTFEKSFLSETDITIDDTPGGGLAINIPANEFKSLDSRFDTSSIDDFDQTRDISPEPDSYSSKHLSEVVNIFKSRETFKINIPKFQNIIQRSNLEKFSQEPNLLNHLYSNLGVKINHQINSNEIPLDLIINKNFNSTQEILNNISLIQINNYKQNFKNNEITKPKRRRIKIKLKKNQEQTTNDLTIVEEVKEQVQEPILHTPKPLKLDQKLKLDFNTIHPPIRCETIDSPSLFGVGLGNSYFHFNKSPIREEKQEKKLHKEIRFDNEEKKSLNYINIDKINSELKKYQRHRGRSLNEKRNPFNHGLLETLSPPPPPPPYYYNI